MDNRNINPRFRPRSQNMKKVSINEIVPGAGEKMNMRELQNKKTASELNGGVNKAMKRFVKQLIEPQKEIIVNTIMDSKINHEKLTAYNLLTEVGKYNSKITDAMARGAEGFNMVRAQADLADTFKKQQEIIRNGGKISNNDEKFIKLMNGDDDLFDENKVKKDIILPNVRHNHFQRKITSMDDVFEDQIYVPPKTDESLKKVDNNKDDDSVPIDPSMFL